jgi:hypothetical protein
MKNTLNILAILLFIACANSTKKISYSDLVSSLVELTDNKEQSLSHIQNIVENFENSNTLLTNLKSRITQNCELLSQRSAEEQKKLQSKIESYQATMEKLAKESREIATEVISDETAVKEEAEKIKVAKKDIEQAKLETLNSEKAIHEAVNVLKRLRNLAIDELQGAQQKSTQMNRFNVTVITPPAFIQFSDFHGELKSLLSKTDSVNRGFISTLILLTQSAGKQTFANPEAVRKIVALIDRILASSFEKIKTNEKQGQEKIASYTAIVENSRALIARLKEEMQRKITLRAKNDSEIVFYKNDVNFLQRALTRREKRSAFSLGLCNEQNNLISKHFRKYTESVSYVNDLRSSLNVE